MAIAALLRQAGADLVGHDPAVSESDGRRPELAGVEVVDDPYELAPGAAAVVVLTEWRQFRALDWPRMARAMSRPAVVDTRNVLDRDSMVQAGMSYMSVGRGSWPGEPTVARAAA